MGYIDCNPIFFVGESVSHLLPISTSHCLGLTKSDGKLVEFMQVGDNWKQCKDGEGMLPASALFSEVPFLALQNGSFLLVRNNQIVLVNREGEERIVAKPRPQHDFVQIVPASPSHIATLSKGLIQFSSEGRLINHPGYVDIWKTC